MPSIDGQTDISNDESVDKLVHKIKDGLVELRSVYKSTISRFRDLILTELGVSVNSENNIDELKARAVAVRGISGNLNMETFILHVSQLTTELDAFEKLGWGILSKPTRNWIDTDISRLFVEATKLAREFNNLETMASLKGNTQSKFAFSLLCHGKIDGASEFINSFELNETEISEAQELVTKLKAVKGKFHHPPTKKELLAALTLMINEKDD